MHMPSRNTCILWPVKGVFFYPWTEQFIQTSQLHEMLCWLYISIYEMQLAFVFLSTNTVKLNSWMLYFRWKCMQLTKLTRLHLVLHKSTLFAFLQLQQAALEATRGDPCTRLGYLFARLIFLYAFLLVSISIFQIGYPHRCSQNRFILIHASLNSTRGDPPCCSGPPTEPTLRDLSIPLLQVSFYANPQVMSWNMHHKFQM